MNSFSIKENKQTTGRWSYFDDDDDYDSDDDDDVLNLLFLIYGGILYFIMV